MAYNKIEANGETLIDLTSDTVTADTLVSGRTAHLASGERVTGTFIPVTGVKGNAETAYRTGNVNLTAANIGAVNKNGDTMSGTLTDTAQLIAKSTNIDRDGDNPAAQVNGNEFRLTDKNNLAVGGMYPLQETNGAIRTVIYSRSGTRYNILNVITDKDGTYRYSVSSPSAFRAAIGLNNVNNTSDANKPISTATQAALDNQQGQIDNAIKRNENNNVNYIMFNNITIPFANNAGFHNSIYRGKYLGTSYTAAQKAEVQAGTFDDLFVGDYWVINGVTWRIAHCDYYLNTGDTATTAHHLVIVPDETLTTSYINATNVTTGAYAGSYMYTTTLLQDGTEANDSAFGKIKAAFGEANLLSIRQLFANAVDSNGNVSGWAWYSTKCFLMNQVMLYGQKAWTNGDNNGHYNADIFNVGIDKTQLALFANDTSAINRRYYYWLRDVCDSTCFIILNDTGQLFGGNASRNIGVRPVFLLS